jgi:phosphohistidine phosphatase SixA
MRGEAMFTRALVAFLLVSAAAGPSFAQQAIFLVRHAERADVVNGRIPAMASDPDLSEAGRMRAAFLARVLADAKITAIYTTEYKRTQQTAAPLAKVLAITPTIVNAADSAELIKEIRSSKGSVLVVGHSNTLPEILKSLGADGPVSIADDEYDDLFAMTCSTSPTLIRLHYR